MGLNDELRGELPDEQIKMRALDELYKRNEAEKWMRIRKL